MITINGENGKIIRIAASNVIHEVNREVYIPELPTIVCNSKKDAELIQADTITFINQLSRKLLKD